MRFHNLSHMWFHHKSDRRFHSLFGMLFHMWFHKSLTVHILDIRVDRLFDKRPRRVHSRRIASPKLLGSQQILLVYLLTTTKPKK